MLNLKATNWSSWKGVVPLVPDQLAWQFMDKKGDKWIPLTNKEKPLVHYSCYAKPMTDKQVRKMAFPFKK